MRCDEKELVLLAPDDAYALHESSACIVDARPQSDFMLSHVVGALYLPPEIDAGLRAWVLGARVDDASTILIGTTPRARDACRVMPAAVRETVCGYVADVSIFHRRARQGVYSVRPGVAHHLWRDDDAVPVDARPPAAWREARVPGAICVADYASPQDLAEALPDDRVVLVLGARDDESDPAVPVVSALEALGMNNVVHIARGFDTWRVVGLPVELSMAAFGADDACAGEDS